MNRQAVRCFAMMLCLAAGVMATAGGTAAKRPTERVSPAPEVNRNAVIWRTPVPPANPQVGDVWVNPKDGMEMVYIAPGQFLLGTSDAQVDAWLKGHPGDKREDFEDEQPQCRVNLPGYWIGRTEVTNAQYRRFVQATGHRAPEHWKGGHIPAGLEDFPVAYVTWDDAREYCAWAGGHLPTELQWEKAARGSDGRVFPWGDQWDAKRCRNLELITGRGHVSGENRAAAFGAWLASLAWQAWVTSHDTVRDGPAVVGSYPAGRSPFGCADMAGNVEEWCADWYDAGAYQRYAKGDLAPPKTGESWVLRGGSWGDDDPGAFRCAHREDLGSACTLYYGFRCARAGP